MGWFSKLVYGVDLDEEQKRQDALDAALRTEVQADLDQGNISEAVYQQSMANIDQGAINVTDEVTTAFKQGLSESFPVKALNGGINLVPTWIWIVAAVFLFIYLGGIRMLIRR